MMFSFYTAFLITESPYHQNIKCFPIGSTSFFLRQGSFFLLLEVITHLAQLLQMAIKQQKPSNDYQGRLVWLVML